MSSKQRQSIEQRGWRGCAVEDTTLLKLGGGCANWRVGAALYFLLAWELLLE